MATATPMEMRTRILIVDDEASICEILRYNLEAEGYEVDCALSAEEALGCDLAGYSLFILDVMMDRMSGFDLAKRLRTAPSTEATPIIFCTVLDNEHDAVMGLNLGGDDYITKPFAIGEVVARVRAVLRRSRAARGSDHPTLPSPMEPDLTFRTLRLDRNEKQLYLDGQAVALTKTELEILLFFLTHQGRVYSREEIIKQVWPNDATVSNRTIDTNITRLRKKIGIYGCNIITRQGFGYGFKDSQ